MRVDAPCSSGCPAPFCWRSRSRSFWSRSAKNRSSSAFSFRRSFSPRRSLSSSAMRRSPSHAVEGVPHPVAQASSPLELAAQHGESAKHHEQARPGDERQREDPSHDEEPHSDGDAARAHGVLQHGRDSYCGAEPPSTYRRAREVVACGQGVHLWASPMIPLRDTIPSRRTPVVNLAIIAANVLVFFYELSLGRRFDSFLYTYGLVPRDFALTSLVTSTFLHGGWLHLLGNMLYLYIFGDNVEDRLGHVRYLVFYLLCGMAAGAAQAWTSPHSGLPMVGASGAIAGVSGAYFLFFPTSRVVTLVPIFLFVQIIEIPAVFFLFMWFVWQVVSGVATLGAASRGGVAVWAHVGGFVAGMIVGPLLRRREG